MTVSSVNTSVFILTALVAAGLAGYFWMQPSGKYSTTSDGATCPFSTASEEEKKKGGKCPVTGAVVRATSPTQTHSTSPPPQSPIKAVRSPPPVPNTPPSSPQTPLPSSPQKASPTKKSPSNSPKQVTFKAQTASEENVTRENPQMSSPNKQQPHSPIQTAPKTVPFEHLLVQETSQDLAHTMVEALVHESVVQVADEMAEKEDYVQVEMTQSTENIASCGTWKTPVIEPHVVEEEDGVNVSPPSSESDEPIANPLSLTKPMSPPKPVSRKNVEAALPPMSPPRSVSSTCDSPSKPSSFVYEEKKMPKTPPPSPVKTVVEASPAKRVASPPLSAHVDLLTNAVEDEPVCAVVDTEVVQAEAEVDTGDAPDTEATEADTPDAGAIEADTLEEDATVDTSGAPKSKSKKKKGKKRR